MKPKLVLTAEAKADVAEIAGWYRVQSLRAAEKFLLAISGAFSRVEAHPTAHVIVDAKSGTRRTLLRKFPHRVLHLIDRDKIVVFAVIHQRRDDPAWIDRLK